MCGLPAKVDSLAEVYAPWFKHNKANLLQAVQYVVGLLDSPSTCQAAASALSNLCDACRNDLTDHVGSFAQLVSSLEGRIPVSWSVERSMQRKYD